jgi:transcriptional regulator with XRE-family HTH domain
MDILPTLRELRQARHESMPDLAARAHVHPMTIWRIERGRVRPLPSTRWWIAAALNCTPDEIRWEQAS